MIVVGSLGYEGTSKAKGLSAEDYSALRRIVHDLPEDAQAIDAYALCRDRFFDIGDITELTRLGFKVEISKTSAPQKSLMGAGMVDGGPMAGGTAHVHVPSIGLLMIDEVTWLEDACTQELQRHLDEGWRILAVCPPNLQRRPDYILGRTKARG